MRQLIFIKNVERSNVLRPSFWRQIFYFLVLVLCFPLFAEKIVLQSVSIVGKGEGTYHIILEHGRIQKIIPASEPVPLEAVLFDFQGKWVMPGLIDLHCALFSSPGGGFSGEEFTEGQTSRNLMSLLKCGITSARVLYAPQSRQNKLKASLQNQIGPRLFMSGPILTAKGGYPFPLYQWVDSLTTDILYPFEKASDLTTYFQKEMDFVYVIASAGKSISSSPLPVLSEELLQQICEEADRLQIPVVAYVETWDELERAVQSGVDQIEGGPFLEETLLTQEQALRILPLMQKKPVFYIPKHYSFLALAEYPETPFSLEAWERQCVTSLLLDSARFPYAFPALEKKRVPALDWLQNATQNLLVLQTQNIPIVASSQAGNPFVFFGTSLHAQLYALEQAGLSREYCLQSVTQLAAKALGKAHELGDIQEGYLADLIVLEADPLQDLQHLRKILWVYRDQQGYWTKQLDPQLKVGLKPAPLTSRFIDDFEDRNLLGPNQKNWEKTTDALWGGTSTLEIEVLSGGAEQSLWAIRFSGQVQPYPEGRAFAGAELNLAPEGETLVDISDYQGIEFLARGKGTFWLKIMTRNVYDFDYYAQEVTLTESWTKVKLPFSSFFQKGFGQKVEWSPDQCAGLAFLFYDENFQPRTIDVTLDELRFYKE